MAAWDSHITTACELKVKPQLHPLDPDPSLCSCPAYISEIQGSINQKSFIKTVLNEKLTFAQRNS